LLPQANQGQAENFIVINGFVLCHIRLSIGLWAAVDILAAGSNVILRGSRLTNGEYRVLRSFDECPIPEAPKAFIRLIRQAQKEKREPDRRCAVVPVGGRSLVSPREWYLLFRNKVFQSFWNRTQKIADGSLSAYEYHLAKVCFCCGLAEQQTVHVIERWWRKHGMDRSLEKLRSAIMPAAWREVAPYVQQWHADQTPTRRQLRRRAPQRRPRT
jgi:hypothetical protein